MVLYFLLIRLHREYKEHFKRPWRKNTCTGHFNSNRTQHSVREIPPEYLLHIAIFISYSPLHARPICEKLHEIINKPDTTSFSRTSPRALTMVYTSIHLFSFAFPKHSNDSKIHSWQINSKHSKFSAISRDVQFRQSVKNYFWAFSSVTRISSKIPQTKSFRRLSTFNEIWLRLKYISFKSGNSVKNFTKHFDGNSSHSTLKHYGVALPAKSYEIISLKATTLWKYFKPSVSLRIKFLT